MKKYLAIVMAVLVCCFAAFSVSADSCKPDQSTQDNITKVKIIQWYQELSSTGMMKSMWSGEDMTFTGFVERVGDKNFIMISLRKVESSDRRAAFETQFHAANGNQIIFGFKIGDPVSLAVTEVANNATTDAMTGKLIMSAVWAAEVSGKDMAAMRETLTTKPIDAYRIVLAGGQIDRSIEEKYGQKMMEKFKCYYQFLDKSGISLLANSGLQRQPAQPGNGGGSSGGADPTPPRDSSDAAGKYVFKKGNGTDGDYIELGTDGKFTGQQTGKNYTGTYKIQGEICTLVLPNGEAVTGKFIGNTIVQPDGTVLERQVGPQKAAVNGPKSETGRPSSQEKQAEPPKVAGEQLTIDQIIEMVAAKLSDDIIIDSIRRSGTKFDLTSKDKIMLGKGGVSNEVIRAMMK